MSSRYAVSGQCEWAACQLLQHEASERDTLDAVAAWWILRAAHSPWMDAAYLGKAGLSGRTCATTSQVLFCVTAVMGAGKDCRADRRHADFVHTAQDRGGQPDCSWSAQPAGQWQNCYRVLHCRAEQPFYSCHWALAGLALPSHLCKDLPQV